MIAYKVLTNDKGTLKSCGNIPDCLKMEYSLTEINKSKIKNGRMFCFSEFLHALYFKEELQNNTGHPDLEIWEIEVDSLLPIDELPTVWVFTEERTLLSRWGSIEEFEFEVSRFWMGDRKCYGRGHAASTAYAKTANTIKLIEKIL